MPTPQNKKTTSNQPFSTPGGQKFTPEGNNNSLKKTESALKESGQSNDKQRKHNEQIPQ